MIRTKEKQLGVWQAMDYLPLCDVLRFPTYSQLWRTCTNQRNGQKSEVVLENLMIIQIEFLFSYTLNLINAVSKCACILCCRCSWFTCMLHHLESSFTSCYASSMGSRLKTTSMKTTSAFQLETTEALTSLPRRHRFRFGRQRTTRRLWISWRRTPTLSRFPWQQSAIRVTLNSLPPEG